MKKIYAFLAAALMSVTAMAGTVVFTAADFTGGAASPGAHIEASKDGVTISSENGLVSTDHIRIFGGGTYTLNFTANSTMSKIEFEWASSGNKYTGPDTETPNATSYSVTATAQMRIAKITVTIDGEGGGNTPGGDTPGGDTPGGDTPTGVKMFKVAEAYNYYDYLAEETEDITIYLYDDEEALEYAQLDLLVAPGTGLSGIPVGTYTIGDTFEAGTAVYGFYDEEMLGCWLFGEGEEDYWELDGGTVTVAKSGDVYTITVDATCSYDESAHKFGYTGKLTVEDGEFTDDDDDNPTVPEGAISVAEAIEIGNELEDKAETAETYTVVGYVGKLFGNYDNEKKDQCWFMCDSEREVGSDAYFTFEAFWCYIDEPVELGDYVAVTGKIMKWGKTIEIKNGQAEKIDHSAQGVENIHGVEVTAKTLVNGQLIIRRGEKNYNVMGQNL